MSLLEKLKAGKRNLRIIRFPGTEHDVALRVLSNAELQDALFATEDLFRKKNIVIGSTTIEAYEDEHTTQILYRALRDPRDPEKPFAESVDELRSLLTREEKDLLVARYNDFEKEVSPAPDMLTEEEMDGLLDEIKKKPEAGNGLSFSTLKRLTIYSASRQLN